MSNTMKQIKWL